MNVKNGTEAVAAAKKWLGTPYCWGGGHGGPVPVGTCVDCSGLVNQVYGVSGVTQTQSSMGSAVNSLNDAAPGDLIFFGPLAPNEAYHVGIYVGGGQMIDAPHTGTNVRYDTVVGFGPVDAIRRLVTAGSGAADGTGSNGLIYTYAQLECVWTNAGGSAQTASMAAAIAMAESGGNSAAVSSTNDYGLWQINLQANGQAMASLDPMTNARAAVAISSNGTNWRPWCTAYGDGACGTKGGAYLASNSPFERYLNDATQPDCSAPINATNAATGTSADLTAETSGQWDCLFHQLFGIGPKCHTSDLANNWISQLIIGIIDAILKPVIQIVAGGIGVISGAGMIAIGIFMMINQSKTASTVTATGISAGAILAGQPEVAAAAAPIGSRRTARSAATAQQQRRQARTGDILNEQATQYGRGAPA